VYSKKVWSSFREVDEIRALIAGAIIEGRIEDPGFLRHRLKAPPMPSSSDPQIAVNAKPPSEAGDPPPIPPILPLESSFLWESHARRVQAPDPLPQAVLPKPLSLAAT
jgi:hypothetical protein